jgi:hypothetical protein
MNATGVISRGEPRASHITSDPQSFVAYAPWGVGLLCAVVYRARGRDVYGWWVGAVGVEYQTAYFKLENYYARYENAFYATRGGDLYGGWVYDYDADPPLLDKPVPVGDTLCHELEHMQFVFAQEWLSFAGDPAGEDELARYRAAELAHQNVNVRFDRLNHLDKRQPTWTHLTAQLDVNIIHRLMRDWPLDCRTLVVH